MRESRNRERSIQNDSSESDKLVGEEKMHFTSETFNRQLSCVRVASLKGRAGSDSAGWVGGWSCRATQYPFIVFTSLKHLRESRDLKSVIYLNAFSGSKAGCQPSGGEIKGSPSVAAAYRHLFILHFKNLERREAWDLGEAVNREYSVSDVKPAALCNHGQFSTAFRPPSLTYQTTEGSPLTLWLVSNLLHLLSI